MKQLLILVVLVGAILGAMLWDASNFRRTKPKDVKDINSPEQVVEAFSPNAVEDVPPEKLFGRIDFFKGQDKVSLSALSFQKTSGETLTVADLSGKYVVLNAWATWCTPCVKELPALENLKGILGEKWHVLAVSVDFDTGLEKIQSFAAQHNASTVASYWDHTEALQTMLSTVGGIPVTYILSPRGEVIAMAQGAAYWDSEHVVRFLRKVEMDKL